MKKVNYEIIKKSKLLITGGTGYIGGQIARYLASNGINIVCMTRGNRQIDSIPIIEGDLLKPETLENACKGVDIVCHLAGALGRGMADDVIRAVNVNGTINMIQAAKKAGVKYFLHISSGAVVGPKGPTPSDETTECHPYTIYEKTKLEGEYSALALSREIDLPLGVARPTFTYGPDDPHKLFMFQLIKKGWFFFIGDGLSTNHPVYIDDLIQGIMLMLEKKPVQEVFILGGTRPVTKKEWAETVSRILKVNSPKLYIPTSLAWLCASILEPIGRIVKIESPITRSRVLALAKHWSMDISKARRELGYSPEIDLFEGVKRTIISYQRNGLL